MVVPEGCPLDIDPIEIGKLIQKIETLDESVRTNNERLKEIEAQLEKTRGIGIGIVLATVGLSASAGSLIHKWWG
jgi:hypothetical protein